MIIHINVDWRGRSDSLKWILEHRPEPDQALAAGSKEWRSTEFLKTEANTLRDAAQLNVRDLPGACGPEALATLSRRPSSIRAGIRTALEGFKPEAEAYARRAWS